MIFSICISCGHKKSAPYKRCRACGFDPSGDDTALAKSVYLSVGRYEDGTRRRRYRQKLKRAARALRDGQEIDYDHRELQRLLAQKKLVESVPMTAVWAAIFRTFLPGIIILAAVYLLIFLIWWLKRISK